MKGLDSHQLCSVVRVRIGVSETILGGAGEDILCAHCRCVLEPDELSSMMGRKSLPTVQEDLLRSTESISTLKSDCTVETGQEFVMFDAATPDKSKDLGATEAVPSPSVMECNKLLLQQFAQIQPPGYPTIHNETKKTSVDDDDDDDETRVDD